MMNNAHEASRCIGELETAGYKFVEEVGGKFIYERKALFGDNTESVAIVDAKKGKITHYQRIHSR